MTTQQFNQFGQVLGTEICNWVPCKRPGTAVLQGHYCQLEPFNIDLHAKKLFTALSENNNGESWTYLPYGPFATLNEFIIWLENLIASQDVVVYAITNGITKSPIGISAYLRISLEHGAIEIGHLHFSHQLKKTPMATEAIYLMLSHVFDDLGYRRCEWKCNTLNEPSKKAALRFGFKFEGIFRQNFVYKNRNRDTAWFSIIDSEWPVLKEKFVRWLSPENFDASGKQMTKL